MLLIFREYLLPALMPFLAGGLLACALHPLACLLHRVTHMRYRPSAVAACLIFYGLAGLLVCNLGFLLFAQTVALFTHLPELFAANILPFLASLWDDTVIFFSSFAPNTVIYMENLSHSASAVTADTLSKFSSAVLRGAAGFVAKLPLLAVNTSLIVISSFFILMDYDTISEFIGRQLSPRISNMISAVKSFLLSTGKNVVKAYFLLMLITFCEVSVGLWLLGAPYFAIMGAVVAAVDILPIFGSGAVLVPWGLYLIFTGTLPRGIGILLLYGVISIVRTIAEPKILGDKIGLPPLVTIISMYVGLRLLGFWGLILTPMAITLLVHLCRQGHLHLWTPKNHD